MARAVGYIGLYFLFIFLFITQRFCFVLFLLFVCGGVGWGGGGALRLLGLYFLLLRGFLFFVLFLLCVCVWGGGL